MIKINIGGNNIMEFDPARTYFKKFSLVDPDYLTPISYVYYIGQYTLSRDVYEQPEEFRISEVIFQRIFKDYPNIPIYNESEVFGD